MVVADPAMARLYQPVERLAQSDLPVLVCGETGTGGARGAGAASDVATPRPAARDPQLCCHSRYLVESELFGRPPPVVVETIDVEGDDDEDQARDEETDPMAIDLTAPRSRRFRPLAEEIC